LLEGLASSAGLDPAQDRYVAGYLAAINDFINMEFIEEETSDDD
jgi:hypothetical protein